MTYLELSSEVSALGFEDLTVSSPLLLTAANLALRELYGNRTVQRTVRLAARGVKPILYRRQITCKNGSPIQIDIPGNAYSFRIHGNCQFSVMNGDGNKLTSVKTGLEAKHFKGIVGPGSSILFFGNFTFTIYDFSVYEEMFSIDERDIPDAGPISTFDIRELYGDFMSFISPATDNEGRQLNNCRLYDGKLEIDSSYTGEIVLTYRRLPELCTGEEDQIIDIPDEYLHLFPLLVASYALLDSDESKARYYKARYEENIAMIDQRGYYAIDTTYTNTNGWA